jgi:excisionase family DNA binding protein
MQERYYRPYQFAAALDISRSYVYLMIKTGKLRVMKIGSQYHIPATERCRFCKGTGNCRDCTWSRS